jgi:hypothetical protein
VKLYERFDTPEYRERARPTGREAEIAAEARFPTGATRPEKGGHP